jgi:DtxR family Mn-dependent transcriptional regulator
MNHQMLSPLIEDYLSLLYIQERDQEKTNAAQLAAAFQVTPPTITATVQRMERDGWVEKENRHNITLTPAGKQAAMTVLRRRMLAECLLDSFLHVPWVRLFNEAHRIEHSLSEEITDRLDQALNFPDFCPYGNPFPGKENLSAGWANLSTLTAPATGVLRRVHEKAILEPGVLDYFERLKLLPGAQVTLQAYDAVNDVYHLSVDGHPADLGSVLACLIYLEPRNA